MGNSKFEKALETLKTEIRELGDELKHERDELNLQIHLLKAEAKDEWEDVEEAFKKFSKKLSQASGEANNIGREGLEAGQRLGHSIREAYQRIRKSVK